MCEIFSLEKEGRVNLKKTIKKIIPEDKLWTYKQAASPAGMRAILSRNKLRLHYYRDNNNFGDMLNENIMDYFGISYVYAPYLLADAICIGSLLNGYISSSKKESTGKRLDVLGSGFIRSPDYEKEFFNCDVNIYALRGELTLARCEKDLGRKLPGVVLGDPALLSRRIFKDALKAKKKYDVGIICHYSDTDSEHLQNIKLDKSKVIYIDIQEDVTEVVKKISECKFILSSAMHGLIVADALGVPNKHVVLSSMVEGGDYKFKDYYSVLGGVKYEPVDLRESVIDDESIRKFKKGYGIMTADIEKICDDYEQLFRGYSRNIKEQNGRE